VPLLQHPDSKSAAMEEEDEEASSPCETHHKAVLSVRMHKAELVVIDHSSVEGPDRSREVKNSDAVSAVHTGLQSKGLPNTINPLHSRKSKLIFSCWSDARQPQAFLNGMLKDVRLCDLNERRRRSSAVQIDI
jgi:hypothetical protein